MLTKKLAFAGVLLASLAACGDTVGEQALIGAGAGAGVAAITDGNLLTGAAIGGAANVAACQTGVARC